MEEKEINLIAKKAKLIEYQNQISWIASEYAKMPMHNEHFLSGREKFLRVALYENLNSIISHIKALRLQDYLSDAYKKMIRDLQIALRCNIDNLELSVIQEV